MASLYAVHASAAPSIGVSWVGETALDHHGAQPPPPLLQQGALLEFSPPMPVDFSYSDDAAAVPELAPEQMAVLPDEETSLHLVAALEDYAVDSATVSGPDSLALLTSPAASHGIVPSESDFHEVFPVMPTPPPMVGALSPLATIPSPVARPSRVPGAVPTIKKSKKREKHTAQFRWVLRPVQRKILNDSYLGQRFPSAAEIARLTQEVNDAARKDPGATSDHQRTPEQVLRWFENRRYRENKKLAGK